jgi:uncharacterized surface anchored protein
MIRLADGTYTVKAKYTGSTQGYVYYNETNQGKFAIEETSAPTGYIRDTEWFYFEVTSNNQTIQCHNNTPGKYLINNNTVFANQPASVTISIPKVDRYTGNKIEENAEFTVYAKSGNLSKPVTFTKQADGSYLSSAIYYEDTTKNANYGEFYVVEKTAPSGYYGDYAEEDGEKTAGSATNKVQYEFTVKGDLSNNGSTIPITNDERDNEKTIPPPHPPFPSLHLLEKRQGRQQGKNIKLMKKNKGETGENGVSGTPHFYTRTV